MKLTRHNGRAGRHGAYNPKHNDRRFDLKNSEHINEEKAKQNLYWDCYQGFHTPGSREEEDRIVYSFEEIEKAFYQERYDAFCAGQHERNRKTGHTKRDRSPEDLRKDKKTCPEESLIQIGTMEQSVSPEVLARIATEFFEEFRHRFGAHIHILDWSLHLDEATPHIHERHVFDCENQYGEIAPQQEKALELLGFELPDPEQKPGRRNNRKMHFDAACRALLFQITEKHGLHLDQEVEYGGRAYLEKQDYILQKQRETLSLQEQKIEEKESELEELTIRISDTETFIEDVAETAYRKAAEAVTEAVREEVRSEDLAIISEHKKAVLSDPNLTEKGRSFARRIFSDLMEKFRGVTERITRKLTSAFEDPEKKELMKQPIRRSIRDRLAEAQVEADALNKNRRGHEKRKERSITHL